MSQLSPALRAGFYPTMHPPPRPLFGVNPSFAPSSLKALVPAYAWIDREIAATTGKIEQGLKPMSLEPLFEGKVGMKMMRNVSTISHALLIILYQTGDKAALERLAKVWRVILDPKRLATGFLPSATMTAQRVSLEQPGVPRILFIGSDVGTPTVDAHGTDLYALDWCLMAGTVAEVKYAFGLNRDRYEAEHRLLKDFYGALRTRLTFLSSKLHKGKEWWAWASTLRHPVESRFAFHYFDWLETGDPEQRAAWEQIGAWMQADSERITLKDGQAVAIHGHHVNSWQNYLYSPKDLRAAQNTRYTEESHPHEGLSMLAGSPYHSREAVEATARNMHLCVLAGKGGKSMAVAATPAGILPDEYRGKGAISVAGEIYPSRHIGQGSVTVPALQVSRGLALTFSHLCPEPEFRQTLVDISATEDALQWGRQGSTVGLVLYEGSRI